MTIKKVNGTLLKKMMLNGAINLKNNHKEIDQLNVFPVPDGDTGTNMQMTVMSGVREMNNCGSSSIIEIAKVLSRGALMGARGNSGVILSQFFRGLYIGMKNIVTNELTINDFAECLLSGYQMAYKAVMEPVEGTILTVVKESALYVQKNKSKYSSINQLLEDYLEIAKNTLADTPNLLPVLKEANVVDSGGAGFVKIVEGMLMALNGIILESDDSQKESLVNTTPVSEANIEFGYCTEFILELAKPEAFTECDLKSPLSLLGNSLVLVRDENLVKVHVHTNRPGEVLEIAQKFGEFIKLKIENMRLQHSELKANSIVEENKNAKRKNYALISVCLGDGIAQTFKDLGVDYVIEGGQTMNPPTEEFVKAIKEVNADNIIIIPNNGNVILAAEQAVNLVDGSNVKVLKAKTIAQGYASLMVFDVNSSMDDNIEEMTKAIENVKSGEITYSIRNTEINGIKISENDYMAISDGEITCATKNRVDAVHELLKQKIDDDSAIVTLFYGNDVSLDEVNSLEDYCISINEDIEVEIIEGKQEIYSYIIAIE